MKLKTVKLISYALIVVIILLVLVVLLTDKRIFGAVAVVLCIGLGVFETKCYKCPECGQFLGSFSNQSCPHCGHKIDVKEKK